MSALSAYAAEVAALKAERAQAIRVQLVPRENAPDRFLCEAELVFNAGPLAGLKLVGFTLWRSPEGEVYVTFPSRPFGSGGERRFFDYLRSADGAPGGEVRRVKTWIVDQYRAEAAVPAPAAEGK